MSRDTLSESMIKELVEKALAVKNRAYAPYSKFHVGAALLADNGHIYAGCNVENASFGLTSCAERNAIFQAIADGVANFKALAVVSDADDYCVPCGACRQVIVEFAKDIPVIMANRQGAYKLSSIEELLPGAFSGESVIGRKVE